MADKDLTLNRRNFLKLGLGSLGTLLLPSSGKLLGFGNSQAQARPEDPHFFLQIFVSGGMDFTYLFDARPLEMTAAGKIQNYLAEDPKPWVGVNGQNTYITRLVDPLLAHRDCFSVVNGVLMATGFDGHDQNTNFFMAGDPFGGESFVPHLNTPEFHKPIDAVSGGGQIFGSFSNLGNTVPLDSGSARVIIDKIKNGSGLNRTDPLFDFIQSRFEANGALPGRFGTGSRQLAAGYDMAPSLADTFSNMNVGDPNGDDAETSFVTLLAQLFRNGGARSGFLTLQTTNIVDTHDPMSAAAQPQLFEEIAGKVAKIFAALRATPYDSTRSLMDVTTVVVGSEFGRTLRQPGAAIDKTGTDHNPLCNSVLMAGKGVKPGLVLGSSDFKSSTDPLSPAHLSLDADALRLMGAPYDHSTGRPRSDLPATFKPSDYLQMASVANTIYQLFGVDTAKYRLVERQGATAPVLHDLLT